MMPVRTTLTVSDDLLRLARRRAADSDRTLKDVVNEALRLGLEEHPRPVARKRFRVRPFKSGGVRAGVNLHCNRELFDFLDRH